MSQKVMIKARGESGEGVAGGNPDLCGAGRSWGQDDQQRLTKWPVEREWCLATELRKCLKMEEVITVQCS